MLTKHYINETIGKGKIFANEKFQSLNKGRRQIFAKKYFDNKAIGKEQIFVNKIFQ